MARKPRNVTPTRTKDASPAAPDVDVVRRALVVGASCGARKAAWTALERIMGTVEALKDYATGKVAELEAEKVEARSYRSRVGEFTSERDALKTRVAELEAESRARLALVDLKASLLEKAEAKVAELEADLKEETARRERNERALAEERDTAQHEVERLTERSVHDAQQLAALDADVHELTEQRDAVRETADRHCREIADHIARVKTSEAEAASLRSQVATLERERNTERTRKEVAEARAAQAERARDDIRMASATWHAKAEAAELTVENIRAHLLPVQRGDDWLRHVESAIATEQALMDAIGTYAPGWSPTEGPHEVVAHLAGKAEAAERRVQELEATR